MSAAHRQLPLFAVLVLLLVSACAGAVTPTGGAASVSSAQRVVIKANDALRFDPTAPSVDVGTPVQVLVQNDGQLLHDAVFQDGLADGAAVAVVAAGGARVLGEPIMFAAPGTYRFVCSQPGHAAGGMTGTITVR